MSGEVGSLRVSLGLDTADFTRGIQDINRKLKAVQSEFQAASNGTKAYANSLEGMKEKTNSLSRQMDLHRAKVENLKRRYEEVAAAKGKDSKEAENLLIAYNRATGAMNRTQTEMSGLIRRINEQSSSFNQLQQTVKQGVDTVNGKLSVLAERFKTATSGIDKFGSTTEQMRTQSDHLTQVMQLQRQKVEDLKRAYEASATTKGQDARETQQLEIEYQRALRTMNQTESELNNLNEQIQQNSSRWGRLQNRLSSVGESLSSTGNKMKDIGQTVATAAGTAFLAVGGALGIVAKKAMDFESQMSSVKSVMAPDEVKQFGSELEKLAVTMGAKTKYSSIEAAQGIEELVKSGVKVTDIINGGLEGALSLATAGELELKDAAEIASTALNAFRDDNITVAKAADILAGAANASATDVGELKFGLSSVSAVASGMGMSFKDTTTGLALFAQNGLKGSDAGTSLKTMMLNLSPHTKAAADMMDSLNLGTTNATAGFNWLIQKGIKPANKTTDAIATSLMELAKQQAGAGASAGKIAKEYDNLAKLSGFASTAFYDQNGNLKSMSEIAGTLQKSMKGLNSEQRQNALQTMFGTDAIRAGNILYREGAKGINDMAASMDKVKAADVAAEKLNNVKGQMEQLQGAVETGAISIGTALLPVISKVTSVIQGLVDKFNGLSPSMQKFIAIGGLVSAVILGIVAALGFITMFVGGVVSAIGAVATGLGALATSLGIAGGSAGLFSAALGVITGPIGIAVAAIIGLGAAAIAIWKNWDSVKAFLTNTWNAISQTAVNVWNGIKDFFSKWGLTILSVITGPIGALSIQIYKHWDDIKSKTSSVFNSIGSFFSSVWNSIKTSVIGVINSLVALALNIYNKFKGSIQTIFNGLKDYFGGIWKVIKNVFLGAILLLIDLVTGNFTKLKSDAQGIFNNLKSAFQQIWNGIKQIFSGALNFIKTYITTVWNGIKTITSSVWNGLKSLITAAANGIKNGVSSAWNGIKSTTSSIWNGIKSFISNTVTGIKNAAVNGFNSMKSSISSTMTNVKTAISDGWNKAKSFLTGIDLKQIGKNIIQGLVNGIGSMASSIVKKVKEIADSVPSWIRKILDIHSPSRVTHQLGEHTGQGFANGIAAKKKEIEKRAKEAADAAKKAFEQGKQGIESKTQSGSVSLEREQKMWQNLSKEFKKGSKERIAADKEVARVEGDIRKRNFDNEKNWFDQKKQNNELSLTQELSSLNTTAKRYKTGSQERIYWEKEIYRVKKEINDKLTQTNEEYAKKAQDINQKLIDDEQKLRDEYQKTLDDRTNSLYSFAGIFDEITVKSDLSGQQLIANLKTQVDTFSQWSENIKSLSTKGIDAGLLSELKNMGPSAAGEIAALTNLSGIELDQYVTLWREKHRLAKEEATNELSGMKDETDKQIKELQATAVKGLDNLKKEWTSKIKELSTVTKDNLNMTSIGKNAVQGLIDGMSGMMAPLQQKTKEIADTVSSTIKKVLGIHSPSRVLRDEVGKFIPLGLAEGISSNLNAVISASNRMALATLPSSLPRNLSTSSAGSNSSGSPVINIHPAPVYIDGQQVAEIQFDYSQTMQASSYNKALRTAGVRK